MKRQLTALILVLAMVTGALPTIVLADDDISEDIISEEGSVQADTISFDSNVEQEDTVNSDNCTDTASINTDNTVNENVGISDENILGQENFVNSSKDELSLDDIEGHYCCDTDSDCICDVCGNEWHQFLSVKNSKDGHWEECLFCDFQTEIEPHIDANADGRCDRANCAYQLKHNWSEWSTTSSTHSRHCLDYCCYESESSSHIIEGGSCTICGYTPCAEHNWSEWAYDQDSHSRYCLNCGKSESSVHSINEGSCAVCGYTSCESDSHSFTGTFSKLDGCYLHSCNICGYKEVCTDTNNDCVCDICGCEMHTIKDGQCTVCGLCVEHVYPGYAVWYYTHACVRCWESENCIDANHDCICDVCGIKTHPNFVFDTTETHHSRRCLDCGYHCDPTVDSAHYDENTNGICDYCGYQMKVETEPDPEPSPEPDPKPDVPETAEPEEGNIVSSNSSTWPVKTVLSKYRTLHEKNPDLYGWITISGAKIDYPVMYSPNNPEKYLNLDFDRNPNQSGTPFLKEQCDLGRDIVVVYAANMEDGSMFHGLLSYAEEAFWRENTEILFDTLYEKGTYEIVAAFYTEEYKEDSADFQIDDILHIRNSQEYKDAVSYIQENAIYDTGVAANYGDGLLTLITDADSSEDGRFVVVAKRK